MERKAGILILCMLFTVHDLTGQAPDTLFSQANTYYQEAQYELAIEKYEAIVDSGWAAAALYFNLGNAYFRIHRIADAILNYERALLLDPHDRDIRFNLALANSYIKDQIEEIPRPFFVRWHTALVRSLSPNQWGWLSLGAFLAALLFFSLYLYSARIGFRRTGFWLGTLLFFVSVSSFIFAGEHHKLVTGHNAAIVYQPSVTVKSSPDVSGTDLFILHEGTRVSLLDEVGHWVEVRVSDGNKGWVPKDAVKNI